jgi:hypothetical protein
MGDWTAWPVRYQERSEPAELPTTCLLADEYIDFVV